MFDQLTSLCGQVGIDFTLLDTPPEWWVARLSSDVASIGVKFALESYQHYLLRFVQHERLLQRRQSKDRTNPSTVSTYVDLFQPPVGTSSEGVGLNLTFAESRGAIRVAALKGLFFYVVEYQSIDDANNFTMSSPIWRKRQRASRRYLVNGRNSTLSGLLALATLGLHVPSVLSITPSSWPQTPTPPPPTTPPLSRCPRLPFLTSKSFSGLAPFSASKRPTSSRASNPVSSTR